MIENMNISMSVNVSKSIKDKIGFLCLGQCGGNIGFLFEHQGYNCLAINTSKEDLSTLDMKYRFHIPEGEGCSHDREKAVILAKKYYVRILEEIKDKLQHQQIIFLIFSTGGGTGSGLAPVLIELLNNTFKDKYFGCICVLPSDDEPMKIHYNSCRCYKQLSNINKLASVFTLDNNKMDDKFKINTNFVYLFNLMLNIPTYTNIKGNIDNAELFKLLTTDGGSIITTCENDNPDKLSSSIIKSWENPSVFANIENDKQITYMGLSLTNKVDIDGLKRYIGKPYDIFVNYNNDKCVSILSGLSFPDSRIKSMVDKINLNKDVIKSNLHNSRNSRIDDILDGLEDLEDIESFGVDVSGNGNVDNSNTNTFQKTSSYNNYDLNIEVLENILKEYSA